MSAPIKSRPILFSAPMVVGLLSGRKTQTRRVVKSVELARGEARGVRVAPSTFCYLDFDGVPGLSWRPFAGSPTVPYPPEKIVEASPYGKPGDRLWVRETWRSWVENCRDDHDEEPCSSHCNQTYVAYAATPRRGFRPKPDAAAITYLDESSPLEQNPRLLGPWKPSIHMPRWASRITLEVTGVRVERLQDISEADARAEGVESVSDGRNTGWLDYSGGARGEEYVTPVGRAYGFASAVESFRSLWESINGADSWAANPWAWAISFRVVTP